MRWEVVGADARTGNEVKVTFEASDQAAAEHLANYNGIFVASVRQLDVPALATPTENHVEVDEGPGRYRVLGVDWTTGFRTTWYVNAHSRREAKEKALNEGIVITRIEFVTDGEQAAAPN
jgi:hypothetical protein